MLNADVDKHHMEFALSIALAMAAIVGGALVFEYGLGYLPCYLCLLQRTPYYIGVPVALIAALAIWQRWPSCVARGAIIIIGLLMVYGAVLSAYHAGIEWAWWDGPADCGATSAGVVTDATNLLSAIDRVQPPSCDEAALRIAGLSLAGWNVLLSLALLVWTVNVLRRRA
ncbi:MAG: disulfide bond formation protein B [Pseudomonadota bacterium]